MPLLQLIYASRPFGFSAGMLLDIMFTARVNNEAANITGCLICRDDLYLQLLEGPAEEVDRIYARIAQDDRHVKVTELFRTEVDTRMFSRWATKDDSLQSLMWSRTQVKNGIVSTASVEEVMEIFVQLAEHKVDADS